MGKKAIVYARYSSAAQADGNSIERQVEGAVSAIKGRGWSLEKVIKDEARSAFHGANRAKGSALFEFEEEAREGKHEGKVLIVENLDRLSRQGVKAATSLIWQLNDAGVEVLTWHDEHLYSPESDELINLMFGGLIASRAAEESRTKRKRANRYWEDRYAAIAEGDATPHRGIQPGWLDIKDGRYAVNQHRVNVLNEIFDLYLSGLGITRIVGILNERDEPIWEMNGKTNSGGWYLPYVHRLLTRRSVLGEYRKLNGELVSSHFYPQVVATDKFARVQAMLSKKRGTTNKGQGRKTAANLLSGIVQCSKCEGTAGFEDKGRNSVTRYKAKSGEIKEYARKHYQRLRCDANRRKHQCSNSVIFDYQVIEKAVLDRLLELTVEESTSPELKALEERIANAERLLENEQTQVDNLISAIAEGGSKSIMKRINEIEAKIEQIEEGLTRAREEREVILATPQASQDIALINSLRNRLEDKDEYQRAIVRSQTNEALKRIIEQIYINEDETFTVWADIAVWHFDKEGNVIGGQAL